MPAEKHLKVGRTAKRKPLLCFRSAKALPRLLPRGRSMAAGEASTIAARAGGTPRRETASARSHWQSHLSARDMCPFPVLGRSHGRCNLARAKQIRDKNFRFAYCERLGTLAWSASHGRAPGTQRRAVGSSGARPAAMAFTSG